MSFPDEPDQIRIAEDLSVADSFLTNPERMAAELAPVIQKLERLNVSPLVVAWRTLHGDVSDQEWKLLCEDREFFLRYVDSLPKRYLGSMDSELDMLRDETTPDGELIDLYCRIIPRLREQFIREMRRAYCAAVRMILHYRKGAASLTAQDRVDPHCPVSLSDLPECLREALTEKSELLEDLELDRIQWVARHLVMEGRKMSSSGWTGN